ncbi:MAG: choice-of-anchor tandem repeat GloVer-containing protein, partial [Limisphaerales bacterium]
MKELSVFPLGPGLEAPHNGPRTGAVTRPVPGRKLASALLRSLLWAAALLLPASAANAGVAFTSLYSFQPSFLSPDGVRPEAGLVRGGDGDFYGTTAGGGTYNAGTVFRIGTNGALGRLYSFTGGNDGANPYAGLVQGRDGNFYGTTYAGGTYGVGTMFKISPSGTLTTLYSFAGGNDSTHPQAALVQASDFNFYGT